MPRSLLLGFLFSIFLMTYGCPVHAQDTPDDTQEETGTTEAEEGQQPEAPKRISTIILEDHRLSVEFVNVTLGEILGAIGQKAGFQVEGSSPSFSKPITTKFTDLDLDAGIVRLFSLVNDNNYLISYDSKGSIAKIKIPGVGKSGSTAVFPGTPSPQQSRQVRVRMMRERRARMFSRPATPGAPATPPQPEQPEPEEPEENPDE